MHPAPSIILFTTLSGLGFGLIGWIGLGARPLAGWAGLALALLALALACGGLLASLAHLGQPQRFLKAFTQWRSSWLSREAVCSTATLSLFALLVAADLLLGVRLAPLGWLVTALALATVIATAMIYAQMKTVPSWRSPFTPLAFLTASAAGGAILAGRAPAAVALLLALGLIVVLDAWRGGTRFARAGSTLATATGLGQLGRLRLLEPPHTGQNYLLREMVHVVGRRHAAKLRAFAFVLAVALPLALLLVLPGRPVVLALAGLLHLGGMLVFRWLFFAQAEHVVGLYYGRR